MSSKDCRNDCLRPVAFPLEVENRAGLSHISFRIGEYLDIREALLRNLDKDDTLSAWTHRSADDPGIALLEGASILGDILTFYQELYANEAFLRTARWRESISDLVRLVGYRLSPGLGGQATFTFEVKGAKAVSVPNKFPLKAEVTGLSKPADFETSEALIAYPWLSRFSLFRPLLWPAVTPATTEFYIENDPSATPVELKKGDRLLIGDATLAHPQRLNNPEIVIVDSTRVLHGITLIKIKGRLRRSVPAVASDHSLAAYKLGRTFHHFGHAGPRKKVNPPPSATATITGTPPSSITTNIPTPTETAIDFTRLLNGDTSTLSLVTRIVEPTFNKKEFPLDAEVQDLPAGVPLIVQVTIDRWIIAGWQLIFEREDVTLLSPIANVRSAPLTWGLLTGTASIVTLADSLETPPEGVTYTADIRSFLFHETVSTQLKLKAAPEEDLSVPSGNDVLFYGTDAQTQNLKSRRLFVAPPGGAAFTTCVTEVEQENSPLLEPRNRVRRLTLDRVVDYAAFPNEKPTADFFGNLADATQGKTETEEVIGTGDSRQTFQTFKLPKAPLTYLLSKENSPPETPELQIFVNQRRWQLVSSLFGRRPDEEIYIVREDADQNSWVQFGDGKTGARLPSGVRNVIARYRTGTGAYGPLKTDTKVQGGARVENLDKIQMAGISNGGSTPEEGDNARAAAPGKLQSLDRLVSLEDFESEALAISGVTCATSSWEIESNIATVIITVLMENGREKEISAVQEVIAAYNRCRGPGRFPVKIREGRLLYVSVELTYALDPTYREDVVTPAIQTALGATNLPPTLDPQTPAGDAIADSPQPGLFGVRGRHFGQPEYAGNISGIVQNVPGVLWVKVNSFVSLGEAFNPPFDPQGSPIDPATLALPSAAIANDKIACSGPHILALHSRHLVIKLAADSHPEVCS